MFCERIETLNAVNTFKNIQNNVVKPEFQIARPHDANRLTKSISYFTQKRTNSNDKPSKNTQCCLLLQQQPMRRFCVDLC